MINKLKKFFQLIRIKEWRAFFLIFLFGFFLSKAYLFSPEKILFLFLSFFCFLTFGYLLNDCFDTKEDFFQKKVNIILTSGFSFKKTFFLALFFAALGLFFISWGNKNAFLFSLLGILSVFLYSSPPFRFKGKPFIDLFTHGFFAGVFFFLL
ncbi:MAG: UbiA family prenyltransferase, partial [Minisyncoccales bacterium]